MKKIVEMSRSIVFVALAAVVLVAVLGVVVMLVLMGIGIWVATLHR